MGAIRFGGLRFGNRRGQQPSDADAHNSLAWALALSRDRPPPDYDDALEHARKAVELAPKDANRYGTLTLDSHRFPSV
jgi:hypothetical protein